MASVFFKFNYTKEDNKELNEIKTIIVPQLNVVDKIVDGGETTFFVKNLGSGANYDKVVSLGGITSLEMLYPQGTWTGNTWGELLRVTITSYNGKRLNTANVRHINPHDICSIRTEKGETTITTNNRVSAGQYNGFEIYKTASTINDMGTIINALPTQSGSSALFPNGNEFITESRDFQASDEGKLLILLGSNITLTMPSGVTFTQGATLGIYCVNPTNKFQTTASANAIEPLAGDNIGANGEIVYLIVSSDGVNDILSSVSSAFVAEKTLNKYLYDKANANNYFGTATLASGTVTVSDIRVKTGDIIFVTVNTPSGTLGFLSASTADIVDGTEFVINSSSALDNSTVNWWIKTP